jgi:putative methyltransferase (TIGR04325 family)
MHWKQAVKSVTPPLALESAKSARHLAQRLLGRQQVIEWEYIPEGWQRQQHDARIKGWDEESVLHAYLEKWPRFVKSLQGTAPLNLSPESSVPDVVSHNILMSYAYVLALSSRNKNMMKMLDWGGGMGHYYLLSQALVPNLKIDYHCKDVPLLAEHGRKLFPEAHFYSDDSCFEQQYDFVLASTSLHYSQDWSSTLNKLAQSTKNYIFVTQLPVVEQAASFVFVQRPYQYGYNTEYLSWCLNKGEFLRCATQSGLQLLREFVVGHRPPIHNAPEQCEYRGFLFSCS